MNNSFQNFKNWPTKKLIELVNLESGNRPKGGVRNIEEGIPSLGGEHLNYEGGFDFKNIRFIPKMFYSGIPKGKIKIGDILMVKDGATTGKVSLVSEGFPFKEAAVNEHVFILRIKSNEVLNKYLFFYLFSKEGQLKILHNYGGSAQGGINRSFAENVTIPLPPLETQKKIVARIEELFSKIDKAIELRKKALKETEQIFPAILQKVFNEAEKKWGVKEIKDICLINPNKTEIKSLSDNMEVSFIPMSAVDDLTGRIIKQDKKLLGKVKKGYTYFREGDVLFAKITPCMEKGKSVIAKNLINGIGFGSTEFHVIRPSKDILPEWIHSYIRQPLYRENAKRYFTGSVGQQRVPEEFIERTKIPLPPLPEQEKIVKYLDSLREKVDKMKQLQQEQLKELNELKKSILDKALKGELVS